MTGEKFSSEGMVSMAFLTYVLVQVVLWSSNALGADGPENTGILTLKAGGDNGISAHLQADSAAFFDIFGPDAAPDSLFSIIQISSDAARCTPQVPSVLTGDGVVTAVVTYVCERLATGVRVGLDAALPPGFTLGVRTPVDHMLLSAKNRADDVIISAPWMYFRAGLASFYSSKFGEKARLGRPHPMYFGWLASLPSGFYLLLLYGVIWSSKRTFKLKWTLSGSALATIALVAYLVLSAQASLTILPVRTAALLYLSFVIAGAVIGSRKEKWAGIGFIALVISASAVNGVEQAIVLRYIESHPDISLSQTVASFFLGTFVVLGLISAGMALKLVQIRDPQADDKATQGYIHHAYSAAIFSCYFIYVMLMKAEPRLFYPF